MSNKGKTMGELLNQKGLIANIERYAINDGNGVRTTVFVKGCYLRCRWCCNPETQEFYPQMSFFSDKCIACFNCKKLCPYHAINDELIADRSICRNCYKKEDAFACTKKCYVGCRKVTGQEMTVKEVIDVVERDSPFYESSGGGVTISGGEPLAQPDFTYALLKSLHERWIDTCIETCGFAEQYAYERILPYIDTIFMDIKNIDSGKHKEWTGQNNTKILDNARYLSAMGQKFGFRLFFRIPIIPGFNDKREDVEKTADFVKENCDYFTGMELLPYHQLGRGKYYSLGRKYELENMDSPSDEHIDMLNHVLADHDIPIYKF